MYDGARCLQVLARLLDNSLPRSPRCLPSPAVRLKVGRRCMQQRILTVRRRSTCAGLFSLYWVGSHSRGSLYLPQVSVLCFFMAELLREFPSTELIYICWAYIYLCIRTISALLPLTLTFYRHYPRARKAADCVRFHFSFSQYPRLSRQLTTKSEDAFFSAFLVEEKYLPGVSFFLSSEPGL